MPFGLGNTVKRARRLSKAPQLQIHIPTTESFRPAEFHKGPSNHKHIIKYNPQSLFSYGFVNPRGSVFNIGMVVRTLVMCAIGTLVSQYRCPTKPDSYTFCFPIMAAAEGLIFASLVSFLLGLFISTTFTRWWTTREKLGSIMNNVTSLTMMLGQLPDPTIKQVVVKLLRWMHLAHSMVYKQANEDYDFNDLLENNVITKEEATALTQLSDHSLPGIVYGWCMSLLPSLFAGGKIGPPATVAATLASVTNSFNASQELAAVLNTQMPYAYLHLLTFTTKVHLAFVIFYGGGVIAQGITGYAWTRIIFGYTIIITNNVIYEGLLRIHDMLVNPLGDDDGDFPTHLYVINTAAICKHLLVPPPKSEPEDSISGADDDRSLADSSASLINSTSK